MQMPWKTTYFREFKDSKIINTNNECVHFFSSHSFRCVQLIHFFVWLTVKCTFGKRVEFFSPLNPLASLLPYFVLSLPDTHLSVVVPLCPRRVTASVTVWQWRVPNPLRTLTHTPGPRKLQLFFSFLFLFYILRVKKQTNKKLWPTKNEKKRLKKKMRTALLYKCVLWCGQSADNGPTCQQEQQQQQQQRRRLHHWSGWPSFDQTKSNFTRMRAGTNLG